MMQFVERYMSEDSRCARPIALPHRSPLGTFEGQQDQPNPVWPISLLCIETEQVFEYPLEAFRRHTVETQGRDPQTDVMWQIESPCAHRNCRSRLFLYSWCRGDVSAEEILDKAIRATAKRRCGEHEFEWDTAKVGVEKFDIW
jgi:hypothetical protein